MTEPLKFVTLRPEKENQPMKLWAGRFQKETDRQVDDFNSSLPFDNRLYREDIQGSIAHSRMLSQCGIITPQDAERIEEGLLGILSDIESGAVGFGAQEDIHTFIEDLLTERVGDAGKRMHTARSRNDQVALDMKLYLRREIGTIKDMVLNLISVLCDIAKQHRDTVMPGYTHLQPAQPITFAHHLMAYANMFSRDIIRLENCLGGMKECPLGSGALAGTTHPIDREMTASSLGFDAPTQNSMDGVSDRDYAIEFLSAASIIMMHLSRFSEEIILWSSWEFKFVELDDAYSTGSSIMPQKKNPDVAELVRGKTGRVYGDLMSLLTVMKGIPLAYNKDMQEDKESVFDAVDTVKTCIPVFTSMLRTMQVLPQNMRAAARKGFINATDCADYLAKKGIPFRDAYKAVGKLVLYCAESGRTLEQLTPDEFRSVSEAFGEDIFEALDLQNCVSQRKSRGGPAPQETSRQISQMESFVKAHSK